MSPLVTVFIFFALLISLIALSKNISGFKGGGGEAIGGHTAGSSNLGDLEEDFTDLTASTAVWGSNAAPMKMEGSEKVQGVSETNYTDGPANSGLNKPREPYHLLQDFLPNAPRDTISCLKASCCAETDFEERTNLTGNYLQRTNNYKREFPDNCSTPLHEFVLSFYKNKTLNAV